MRIDPAKTKPDFQIDVTEVPCGDACTTTFGIKPFYISAYDKDFFTADGAPQSKLYVKVSAVGLGGKVFPEQTFVLTPPALEGTGVASTLVNVTSMGWDVLRRLTVSPRFRVPGGGEEEAAVEVGLGAGEGQRSGLGVDVFICPGV